MSEPTESFENAAWSFDPERIRMAARSGWVTLSSDDALDLADEIERLRSALVDSGCGLCDPSKRKTKLDHDLLHGYVHPTSVTQ